MKKLILKYTIVFVLGAASVLLAMRSCEPNLSEKPDSLILQHQNDSLTRITAAYQKRNSSLEKFVLQQNVKIKSADSARTAAVSKFRILQKSQNPCEEKLPEIIKQTETIIKTDSTEIEQLKAQNDSLQEIHKNDKIIHQVDVQKHENDSSAISGLRAELKSAGNKKFWNGFKLGFGTGAVIGFGSGVGVRR